MKRFLLDNDGSNLLHHLGEDVESAVADLIAECPANVTTYLLCSGAGSSYWPTRIGHVDPRARGLLAAHERGIDPLEMILTGLQRTGRETFLTYRMNDVHNPADEDNWNTPKVRQAHPDCVVGLDEIRAGQASWMSYCLDYARPEVREFILSLIEEQLTLYGTHLDGFQLDWMRFPRHLSGSADEVWDKRQILTDFVAQVRGLCRQHGVLLATRVPPCAEGCRLLGFDLAAWGQQGLIDFLVPCPFLTTDWRIPVDAFREAVGDLPIYPGFDFGFGPQVHFPESLRGICANLHDAGGDGIYVFNFPCWTEYLAARPYHWLEGLEDTGTSSAKPLCLSVNHERHRQPSDNPGQIPAVIAPGGHVELVVDVPRRALPARQALCLVDSGGDLELSVNGAASVDTTSRVVGRSPYRAALFMEYAGPRHDTEHLDRPEDCRVYAVDPASLAPGANTFVFRNATGEKREIQRLNLGLW